MGVAAMKPFDIGHVPEGWTRGEQLAVTPPNDPLAGFVRQEDIGFLAAGEEPNHEHIYRLAFTSGEGARVAAWLQWWHAED